MELICLLRNLSNIRLACLQGYVLVCRTNLAKVVPAGKNGREMGRDGGGDVLGIVETGHDVEENVCGCRERVCKQRGDHQWLCLFRKRGNGNGLAWEY